MSVVLAIALGAGVLLVFDALTAPSRPARRALLARAGDRVTASIAQAGLASVRPGQLVAASAASALVGAAGVLVVLGSSAIAALALVAGAAVPWAWLGGRRRARRRAMRSAWPEAIELLASSVRAGDTLPAAIAVVGDRGPEELRPAFRAVVADHRVGGDLSAALRRLGEDIADPTADRVVATLVLAHRVGGRELGRVLRTLGTFLREDAAVRKEIEARQSWTVVAARVSAAAPLLVLLLVASRPHSIAAFDSPAGVLVLAVGAALTIVGYRMMLAIGRLPEEQRLAPAAGPGADR